MKVNAEGRMNPIVHVERLRRAYKEQSSSAGSEQDALEEELAREWANETSESEGPNVSSRGSESESSTSSTSSGELMPPPANVRRSTRVRQRPKWHEDYFTSEDDLSEYD